ncbi:MULTISPECIES: helix-turn-helix transcriptional regulator [Rhizobium/Agrobacterium group]|uniref:helix-turn-helix transcriptional regulator n=1 Tax=Rhizobium/Agrobacterium group TaxID=227290 RepID=UPI0012E717E0|nr:MULTISPECIES: helix-turn-helix transcriptional regulator [Rhizobium/Agrobacterium group]MCF1470542.1 helix-turn-helix transcriptional regulator [Allorhizobium ampelinum]MVA50382.1 hypothetical protein [Agrobacterium vitis]NSZ53947.1 helix-turn-helix transcriptional regulator [Agrobacterium vitis]NTA32705.1 helix-turn-helix transcriptional regulator [Agrobacterium vitis]
MFAHDPLDLIAGMYEAAVMPETWPGTIDRLCAASGFWGGWFFATDDVFGRWVIPERLQPTLNDFLSGGWASKDDRLARLSKHYPTSFVRDHDILSKEEMDRSPLYQDFLIPRGMGAGAATLVQTPEETRIVFAMERSAAEGPVPDTSLHALNMLRPHLARALALTSYALKQQMQASVVALDSINVAAAVLNGSRKVIESNQAFSRLSSFLKPGAFGILKLADSGADKLFQDAFTTINRDDTKAVRSIPQSTESGREGCVIHIIPLRGNAREVFIGTQALIIAVVAGGSANVRAPILRGLYDLTAAEARLVERVVAGQTLRDAALTLGVSYETARSQIKTVFLKTGSKSQKELVLKLTPFGIESLAP